MLLARLFKGDGKMDGKVLEFIVNAVRREERDRADAVPTVHGLSVKKSVGELIAPTRKCVQHHRQREMYWIGKLTEAEKKLREDGVTVEYDANGQYANSLISGSMYGPSGELTAKIDNQLLDVVKRAKASVLSHRTSAEGYERHLQMFLCCDPATIISLAATDVAYFRLVSLDPVVVKDESFDN